MLNSPWRCKVPSFSQNSFSALAYAVRSVLSQVRASTTKGNVVVVGDEMHSGRMSPDGRFGRPRTGVVAISVGRFDEGERRGSSFDAIDNVLCTPC